MPYIVQGEATRYGLRPTQVGDFFSDISSLFKRDEAKRFEAKGMSLAEIYLDWRRELDQVQSIIGRIPSSRDQAALKGTADKLYRLRYDLDIDFQDGAVAGTDTRNKLNSFISGVRSLRSSTKDSAARWGLSAQRPVQSTAEAPAKKAESRIPGLAFVLIAALVLGNLMKR